MRPGEQTAPPPPPLPSVSLVSALLSVEPAPSATCNLPRLSTACPESPPPLSPTSQAWMLPLLLCTSGYVLCHSLLTVHAPPPRTNCRPHCPIPIPRRWRSKRGIVVRRTDFSAVGHWLQHIGGKPAATGDAATSPPKSIHQEPRAYAKVGTVAGLPIRPLVPSRAPAPTPRRLHLPPVSFAVRLPSPAEPLAQRSSSPPPSEFKCRIFPLQHRLIPFLLLRPSPEGQCAYRYLCSVPC